MFGVLCMQKLSSKICRCNSSHVYFFHLLHNHRAQPVKTGFDGILKSYITIKVIIDKTAIKKDISKMWNEDKTLVIITGASRGFGQAVAIQMSKNVENPTFLLLSRDQEGLKETEKLVKSQNDKSEVIFSALDLGKADNSEIELILNLVDFKGFQSLILVHNAGSLGNQGTVLPDG